MRTNVSIVVTLIALLSTSQGQDCRKERNAANNKCNGVGCGKDGECQSGICFREFTLGQNTCSGQKTCATTAFAHQGRCDGVICDYGSQCLSLTCINGKCQKNDCFVSTSNDKDRCEGILCTKGEQCRSGFCFANFCSGR